MIEQGDIGCQIDEKHMGVFKTSWRGSSRTRWYLFPALQIPFRSTVEAGALPQYPRGFEREPAGLKKKSPAPNDVRLGAGPLLIQVRLYCLAVGQLLILNPWQIEIIVSIVLVVVHDCDLNIRP